MGRRRLSGSGSVTRLRDGRWQARLGATGPDGQRVRQVWYGRTRAEAEAHLTSALADRLHGLPTLSARGPTLAAYCESWLAGASLRLRPRTVEKYRQIVQTHILPDLGTLPLTRLEVAHVNGLLARKRAGGLAPATCAAIRTTLRAALAAALRQGLLRQNVAALSDPPRLPDPQRPILTPQQAGQLLAAAAEDPDGPLWTVALTTGARLGELLGLQWSDLDSQQETLEVRRTMQRLGSTWAFGEPKTQRARRVVPLSPLARAALDRQRARQAALRLMAGRQWSDAWDGLVFTGAAGTPRFGPAVARHLRHQLVALGLPPNVGFHGLRRTAASLLAQQGLPIQTVADYLGDGVITALKHYVRVLPGSRREAAARLDSILTGTSRPG